MTGGSKTEVIGSWSRNTGDSGVVRTGLSATRSYPRSACRGTRSTSSRAFFWRIPGRPMTVSLLTLDVTAGKSRAFLDPLTQELSEPLCLGCT